VLVAIHSFGSIWSKRPANSSKARDGAAYFNTTGILVGDRYRHRSCLYGHVRIDSCTGFRPEIATCFVNWMLECDELQEIGHIRKLFVKTVVAAKRSPDRYLVSLSSDSIGRMARHLAWASPDVRVVSFSEGNEKQEVLLLAPAFGWIRGANRTVCVDPNPQDQGRCTLATIQDARTDALYQR
jgi:hypothetical protein